MNKAIGTTTLEKRRFNIERFSFLARGGIVCILGFMIGRGVIEGISPMLVAYYGCMFGNKKLRLWALLSSIVGLVSIQTVPNIFKYLAIMVCMNIIGMGMNFVFKKITINIIAAIGGATTVIVGVLFHMYFKLYQISIFTVLLEGFAVFFLTILFRKGMLFLTDYKKEEVAKETYISFSLIACAAVLGMLGINVIHISLIQLVALNLILYVGYQYGVEASSIMGAAIGFAAYYTKAEGTVDSFIIWSILGVISGLFREIGKIGTAIAYLAAFIILNLAYGTKAIDLKTIEMLVLTIGLFLIVPAKKKDRLLKAKPITLEENEIENIVHYKLDGFAKTYENLAKNFIYSKSLQEQLSNNEINQLIDHVADKVCKDCSLCNMCWQKDFYDTYRTIYSVLAAVEKKGEVLVEDIPEEFYKKCLKVDEFVIMINRVFELYKANLVWENKMIEHRSLFADQFLNVSQIIKDLSENISRSRNEEIIFIKKLKEEMVSTDIEIVNVYMEHYPNERKEVVIDVREIKDTNYIKELLKIINKIDSYKFSLKEVELLAEDQIKRCIFTEKESFKLVKGYANINKKEQSISGDCFTFIDLEGGKDIIALSDGMGSGEQAFIESKATIEMLEQLVEGGFDIDVAIKTVNSILGIRNNHQAFATLDISMVDRYTGECNFIKNGAVTTYLKRGKHIEQIKTDTLPLGMFKEAEYTSIKRRLKADDLVIMMSDGISDSSIKNKENEPWLEEVIEELDTLNPQKIADTILDLAKEKTGGNALDDMTVLVFRVWERNGF